MSTEENKAIVRRWNDELGKGNQAIYDFVGEVDFHACNSTDSSSERASFLTSPPI
jgi:hypothetical protein